MKDNFFSAGKAGHRDDDGQKQGSGLLCPPEKANFPAVVAWKTISAGFTIREGYAWPSFGTGFSSIRPPEIAVFDPQLIRIDG